MIIFKTRDKQLKNSKQNSVFSLLLILIFQVQPWQSTTELEVFQTELNAFYNNAKNAYPRALTNADVAKGDKFYAGQHMDGKWYRVKV